MAVLIAGLAPVYASDRQQQANRSEAPVDPLARPYRFDVVDNATGFQQRIDLRGIHARVESLSGPYDIVSCRAFASLVDFTTWSRAAMAPHAVWLAMKGKHPESEIAALPSSVEVFHVEPLSVPGLDAERCIVWMRRRPA